MTKKMTRWFGPDEKPVRVGVWQVCDAWECDSKEKHGFQYWNGSYFGLFAISAEKSESHLYASSRSCFQKHHWRGFTTDQERE